MAYPHYTTLLPFLAHFHRYLKPVAAGAKETVISWDNLVYMQDMTPEVCSQAPLNTQKTLTDIRDGNTYTVARIKNQTNDKALCWMTQNLRIINKKLTSSDSDTIKDFTLPASIVINKNDDPKQFSSSDQYEIKVYYADDVKNGAYYNWFTATAGTGNADIITTGANAPNSICPKGWRLPTGGNTGEYYELLNGLSPNYVIGSIYQYVISGFVSTSVLQKINETGYYWSSTLLEGTNVNSLVITTTTLITDNKGHNTNRSVGTSIRCVAR